MNYENKTLEELSTLTVEYIKRHWTNGGASEFDTSINDISRAVIDRFKKEHDHCYLGKINDYDCDRNNPDIQFVEYTGQKIYNFQYAFVIPSDDQPLREMIREHNRKKKTFNSADTMELIEQITKRVCDLGGIHLHWS